MTTTSTLSRIDTDGARPLTYDEFVEFVDSIADHLHADSDLIDPSVSGQASTGEVAIVFGVLMPIGDPELNGRLTEIFDSLSTAHDLVWSRDPAPRTHSHAATMLHLRSQHLDKLDESSARLNSDVCGAIRIRTDERFARQSVPVQTAARSAASRQELRGRRPEIRSARWERAMAAT
ncbi:hypothetical protein [Candidatus Poriferisodalis sp.]|uniref:hypothetical protein n=1 Tax=Candidatus Poriferisodalis sp. TaxID=3101277 RepID=UPI003C6EE4A8